MSNTRRSFSVHTDSDGALDVDTIQFVSEYLYNTASAIRSSGRPVLRKVLADELGIDHKRLSRIVKKLEITSLFD